MDLQHCHLIQRLRQEALLVKSMQLNPATWKDSLRDKVVGYAKSAYANTWLAGISFAEASFFPVPPDVLLIAMLLTNSSKWLTLALITTVSSVAGAMLGYLIGAIFFDYIGVGLVSFYGLQEKMDHVQELFSENTFMAIFLAAFTPIPFKVFTIAGGLFKVPLLIFVVASFLGRGIRFFAIAFFLKLYGKAVGDIIYKYFNIVSTVLLVAILTLFFISL